MHHTPNILIAHTYSAKLVSSMLATVHMCMYYIPNDLTWHPMKWSLWHYYALVYTSINFSPIGFIDDNLGPAMVLYPQIGAIVLLHIFITYLILRDNISCITFSFKLQDCQASLTLIISQWILVKFQWLKMMLDCVLFAAFSVSSVLGYCDSPIPPSIIGIPRSSWFFS